MHSVSAVVHDGERAAWSVGPDVASFWRSACKAMQLTTSLECVDAGVADALADEDLAVGASSHSGQPVHVARVEALLARFGLDAEGLRCGAHWPMHEPSARALPGITAVHNNCSGKHTFMLAAAISQGWDPEYLPRSTRCNDGTGRASRSGEARPRAWRWTAAACRPSTTRSRRKPAPPRAWRTRCAPGRWPAAWAGPWRGTRS